MSPTRHTTDGARGSSAARGLAAVLTVALAASCSGPAPAPAAGEADPPVVRLMDGRGSEALRLAFHHAGGRRPSAAELDGEAAWIDTVSAPLRAFWDAEGERILRGLAEDTGVEWKERSLNVYFVRQPLGALAFSLPLVVDLSVMARVPPNRAAFHERLLVWALVHELAHRVYDQRAIARSTSAPESPGARAELVAGGAHDWIDLVTAFVLRDVLGEEPVRLLLYNRGLQRTVGLRRLELFDRRLLSRWRPSRDRPLPAWLDAADEADLDLGVHRPDAAALLESRLAGAASTATGRGGRVPADRVRAAADEASSRFELDPAELAQLLSDWEGIHGAGRLEVFPYRDAEGSWAWE
jgi:hypothetical protein